jgi:uncharacterized spore protein YtfJ
MDQINNTNALTQNVDMLFSNLENFTQSEGVIGKPVTQGDKTFLPVVSVTLGYGSGNSANKSQQNGTNQAGATGANMAGGALGLGAKLTTEAVIVIDKDNVSLIQLSAAGSASQLIDKLPQMLSGIGLNKQGQGQQGNPQGQNDKQGKQ